MPNLPDSIRDWIVEYAPWLSLLAAGAAFYDAFMMFAMSKTSSAPQSDSVLATTAFLTVAAGVAMLLAFFWLRHNRLLGWYALAVGIAIQFVSQLLVLSASSILYNVVELAVSVYILWQIRGYYSA